MHFEHFRYTETVHKYFYEWGKVQPAIWWTKSCLLNKTANRQLVIASLQLL